MKKSLFLLLIAVLTMVGCKKADTNNDHDQFVRAWKELGRYSSEVREYVEQLKEYGVAPLGKET